MRPSNFEFHNLRYEEYYELYHVGLHAKRKSADVSTFHDQPPAGIEIFVVQPRAHSHICRMYHVLPTAGELYFLRMLLLHVPARSYNELLTFNNEIYATFHAAAIARALVASGEEAKMALEEAKLRLATPE